MGIRAGGGYNSAQAVSDVSAGLTQFGSPNLQMPNGAYLAHTIFVGTSSVTINTGSDTSVYSSTGSGSQSVPLAAFWPGARFHLSAGGTYSTGLASVATLVLKVKAGSTTIATFTTPALPTSVTGLYFKADIDITIRTSGASGVVVCTGGVSYTTSTVGIAAILNPLVSTSPVSVDLSQATTKLDITASFSSLIGSPSITVLDCSIDQTN